jgi:methionyl-tRNA formyltransferase
MTTPLRLVFMGTPELARTLLLGVAPAPWVRLEAVVSQPDRPSGRHLQPTPPPVKLAAQELGVPVLQPLKARDPEFLNQLRDLAPDLILVAAYGQILPAALLEIPRWGCLNVHTSLLPRWRGAAPIQWAIASGDPETGVTLMKMDVGMDTGPVLNRITTPIAPEETSQSLHDRLARLGVDLVLTTVPDYVSGRCLPIPQPLEGVTHARKITREDGRVDWSQSAAFLDQRRRAFTPWPGAYAFIPGTPQPRLLKIHSARPDSRSVDVPPGTVLSSGPEGIVVACGTGSWVLTEVQLEGGRRLSAQEFAAGHAVTRLE